MKIVAKPVKMVAFFWPDRHPRPYKFRIPDSRGEEMTVTVDRTLGVMRRKIAGIDTMVFECQSIINGMDRRYELKYLMKDARWELYKI